jgi:hypothetical protein
MACGNNMVSRSGLQSAPVSIAMPVGPGPAQPQPGIHQVAAILQQTRAAMDQAERRAASATTPAIAAGAVKDAQRALDAARRMRGPTRERAALVRELERKLNLIKREAERTDLSATTERDRQRAAYASAAEHNALSPMRLGVASAQTPIDAVLQTRAVPLDIPDLLRQALANPVIAQKIKDELPEAMRKVQEVSSHAPGIAVQQIAGLTIGRASPKATLWSTTVTSHGQASGFAYEVVAAARFIDRARTPGNGGNPLQVVKGEDELLFGPKLPAGPNRKHVEADVMVVKTDGYKIGIDSKAYSSPFGPSNGLKAELDGIKEAIRQGEVHEFHFAVRDRISPTAKELIEAADMELRAEIRDRTPPALPTISDLQAERVDWSKPVICWHENLG